MTFTLAHFSDVHLAPVMAGEIFANFRLKRLLGGLSWNLRRRHLHFRVIADALAADIKSAGADHICFTGDLINISSYREFERGLAWLRNLAEPDRLSLVPGNHDAYVRTARARSLDLWANYFSGGPAAAGVTTGFPFVRLRRNIALIGLSSASPQSLYTAGGTLGPAQLAQLGTHLNDLGNRGFYRVVMIHHPPLPDLCIAPRALTDASELQNVLEQHGAELVLHGHNHAHMHNILKTATGDAQIISVPSASMSEGHVHDVAAWYLYRISRARGEWQTECTVREWQTAQQQFSSTREFQFRSGKLV